MAVPTTPELRSRIDMLVERHNILHRLKSSPEYPMIEKHLRENRLTDQEAAWLQSVSSYRRMAWLEKFQRGLTDDERQYVDEQIKTLTAEPTSPSVGSE